MRTVAFMVTMLVVVAVAAPAMAADDTITIEIGGVTYAPAGSITTVAEQVVDPDMVGASCTGTTETGNNASEHANNDFILISGSSTAVISDWERVAGAVVSTNTTLVLGDTITVQLRIGSDGVSSGMVHITLSCAQPEPTTTTTTTTAPPATTTTTTAPPPPTTTPPPGPRATTTTTTAPPGSTTTTEAPPEGGVSAGGGSMAEAGEEPVIWLGGGALVLAVALLLVAYARRTKGIAGQD